MFEIEIKLDNGFENHAPNLREASPLVSSDEGTVLQVLYGKRSISGADLFCRSESTPENLHITVKSLC